MSEPTTIGKLIKNETVSNFLANATSEGIEEFTHKLGLQKYLKYCKDNGIDKKTICEK